MKPVEHGAWRSLLFQQVEHWKLFNFLVTFATVLCPATHHRNGSDNIFAFSLVWHFFDLGSTSVPWRLFANIYSELLVIKVNMKMHEISCQSLTKTRTQDLM